MLNSIFTHEAGKFKLRIFRDDFGFSAGHLLILEQGPEMLHGHNYLISVELEGALSEPDFLLIDFRTVKEALRKICKTLNHRILIPLENRRLQVAMDGPITRITADDMELALPTSNVLCLRLPNLSTEMLAFHIFREIHETLGSLLRKKRIATMTVEVTESPGQSAAFEASV